MRIFNNESMWDAENQQWYDTYTINNKPVSEEIYHEQLEIEMLVADDEMEVKEESYLCKCCSCDNDDCDEYNCTCGKPDCDDRNILDNDNIIDCDCDYRECNCPDCVAIRNQQENEDICSECRETDCVCDYEECQCNDCRSQRHDDIVNASVGKAFEKIMNADGCEGCIVEALFEMSLEMKRLGWSDHKMYIDDCNC